MIIALSPLHPEDSDSNMSSQVAAPSPILPSKPALHSLTSHSLFARLWRCQSQADRYKSQGNAALQAGQFAEAIELYTKAIALEPNCEVYFSNRAAAYAGLQRWREALDDSNEAVTLKPNWVKGWVRKGTALSGLGKHEEARKAYLKATQIEPGNSQLVQKMEAAAAAAAQEKEKRWEDDLWSDDEAPPAGEHGAEARSTPAVAAGDKRAAGTSSEGVSGADAVGAKRARQKPSASLLAQLDRSLKDASEDSMRACLAQMAGANEELCERALHILEGLNAASSEGSADEDDDGGGAEAWLRGSGAGGPSGGAGGLHAAGRGQRRRRAQDSDSD